jgi:hypothetical protein
MSIRVEFEGFVNEVKPFDWGTVYNVSHSQRRKNEAGEWVTDGYDYFDVTGEAGLDVKDRVKIVGTLKTKRFDKRDGSKGIALQVRAESITKVGAAPASVADMQKIWPDVKQIPDDTPF